MRELLCVTGGNRISGSIQVSGAKNAALPIIVAGLLSEETCVFHNVPDLEDIGVLMRLLRYLGAEAKYENGSVTVTAARFKASEAPYAAVKALRASFWVLGPLIARLGEASVALPGGDAIGTRPVDLHLRGLEKLGVDIRLEHGVVHATTSGPLNGAEIVLDFPSVGATHQLLMTTASIPERSVIRGAACEPEVVELARLLSQMGAQISGAGTDTIEILGCEKLSGCEFEILGDRIEAATYLAAAAMTGGEITVSGVSPDSLVSTLDVLRRTGCEVTVGEAEVSLQAPKECEAVSFRTAPFPGVATDVQPILMALMCVAKGTSVIEENVFESRFGHVAAYRRFGAKITTRGRVATVEGVTELSSVQVEGLDIRAAVGMVLMALCADGTSQISEIHHIDRGYQDICGKLRSVGAEIVRLPAHESREVIFGC